MFGIDKIFGFGKIVILAKDERGAKKMMKIMQWYLIKKINPTLNAEKFKLMMYRKGRRKSESDE